MILYFIPNCYSTQIEGRRSLFSFRFRYTVMGVAYPRGWHHGPARRLPLWVKCLPHFSLGLFYHTGQSAQWMIFKFRLFGLQIGYKTAGERKPEFVFRL